MNEIVTVNGYKLSLPIGLNQVIHGKVKDSYQDFLQKGTALVQRHLTALTTMLPKYMEDDMRILHCFGGVGVTAQVIDQTVKTADHVFWERDPVLVDYLRKHYAEVELVNDSYGEFINADLDWLATFDAILFDPSVGSIKAPLMKEVWRRMGILQPKVIWLSDTACSKIHINAKYYERNFAGMGPMDPTAEGYLDAYSRWLHRYYNLGVVEAMREAQETYAVLQFHRTDYPTWDENNLIPYI